MAKQNNQRSGGTALKGGVGSTKAPTIAPNKTQPEPATMKVSDDIDEFADLLANAGYKTTRQGLGREEDKLDSGETFDDVARAFRDGFNELAEGESFRKCNTVFRKLADGQVVAVFTEGRHFGKSKAEMKSYYTKFRNALTNETARGELVIGKKQLKMSLIEKNKLAVDPVAGSYVAFGTEGSKPLPYNMIRIEAFQADQEESDESDSEE